MRIGASSSPPTRSRTTSVFLLFDPLALPSELEDRAALRETAIVLTDPWHRRDAVDLADRLSATLYVPPPDEGDSDPVPGIVFRAGDLLPVGVEAFAGFEPNDLVLWVEGRRVVVVGDTLIDRGDGLELPRRLAARGRRRRADPRWLASPSRAPGRIRARDARRADGPGCTRKRSVLGVEAYSSSSRNASTRFVSSAVASAS